MTNPRRCLHVVPTYYPAVRYGGPIHSIHGLCRSLVELGEEIHVFTTNVDGAGVSPVELGRPIDLDGVKVWYFPTGVGRRLYRSPAMRDALESQMASFDIVHLHSVFLWPTAMAARIARDRAVPYVLAPRGMLVDDLIRAKNRVVKRAWIGLIERANVASAAAIHVTSEIECAELEKLGLKVRSYALVPNGVVVPPRQPAAALESGGPLKVLSLGRISWKKGIDRLIAAMVHTQDAELVIAGPDEEGASAGLKSMCARLGLTERVRFLGPVQGEEKAALMRECAVLALASLSENFGNVVLEAMASARPVVVTPQVGLADVVAQTGSGLVAAGGPVEFGRALSTLLQNAELRAQCGAAGYATARDRFSWPVVARQMRAVYQRHVSARREGGVVG